jgi:hypothetical protein
VKELDVDYRKLLTNIVNVVSPSPFEGFLVRHAEKDLDKLEIKLNDKELFKLQAAPGLLHRLPGYRSHQKIQKLP